MGGEALLIGTASFFVLISLLFGWAFAYTRRRNRRPELLADDTGLTLRRGSNNRSGPSSITWANVRAWGVVPASPGSSRPAIYIIATDSYQLTWSEPPDARLPGRDVKGDRQAAYRERAEQIHALLVARTGQPLKDARLGRSQ